MNTLVKTCKQEKLQKIITPLPMQARRDSPRSTIGKKKKLESKIT